MEHYQEAKDHTLVDIYRCWSLWSLALQAGKRGIGAVIEIGVWRGGTGLIIAKATKLSCPEAEVFLCDTFSGVTMASERDAWYQSVEHSYASVDIVRQLLRDNCIQNAKVMQGRVPDDFQEIFADKIFRFAHIDVDVYDGGKQIFQFLFPRMKPGGIIVFDDYGFVSPNGITDAVEDLAQEVEDAVCVTNLNG